MYELATKRIYESAEQEDGYRILVDRLWPRGIKKEDAQLDSWMKQVAPSTELRKWFHQEGPDFELFTERYQKELKCKDQDIQVIKEKLKSTRVTLLYAAKDRERNHAVVLRDYLEGM